ncbi:energy-coupling factor transporter transmembrane component T [Alkalibacillus silvisoli]|uniref:Energy-coupling factor transporter transmembrane component T n=1 Tax=Alkalibacillus silvisoli TaxID=392823 RepID=A0ABN1A961_9BACI
MVRGIQSFHPFVLLVYYVLIIIGLMLYQHPLFLLGALFLIGTFNYILDKGRELKKWGFMIGMMSTLIILLTPIFNRRGNQILFHLFDQPIMLEAVIQGIMIASTLVGILAIFVTFNIVLTPDKLLYLFSKVLPQWALLTMLSMRFVPLLIRKVKEMMNIQQVKGLAINQGSVHKRAKNGMQIMQMLLTNALEDSIQAADSMSARGYGLQKRSNYKAFKMKSKDWLTLGYLMGFAIILLFGWAKGDGVLQLEPVLETIMFSGSEYIYFITWLFLIGFPILTEGKEVIHWKYYQWKM